MQESIFEHPREDVLEEYVMSKLSEQEAVRVEEHLLVCPVCIEAARFLDDYAGAVRSVLERNAAKTRSTPN